MRVQFCEKKKKISDSRAIHTWPAAANSSSIRRRERKGGSGGGSCAWLSEVHRSSSRTLCEPAKPRIRNIRATDIRVARLVFFRHGCLSSARAGRACPVWSRILPEDYRTPEWRGGGSAPRFLFFFSFSTVPTASSSVLSAARPSVDYADIVSSEGLTRTPSAIGYAGVAVIVTCAISSYAEKLDEKFSDVHFINFFLLMYQSSSTTGVRREMHLVDIDIKLDSLSCEYKKNFIWIRKDICYYFIYTAMYTFLSLIYLILTWSVQTIHVRLFEFHLKFCGK